MRSPCECASPHPGKRIVLTGGPGAGKTAVLELIRKYFCRHVRVLPEAASILFGGGFPREPADSSRRAAQRAIFHVQHELERLASDERPAIVLCDRGTLDGLAYWPGSPDELLRDVGTTMAAEIGRYDTVIHLRTPGLEHGYNHQNAVRTESAAAAAEIDARIEEAWRTHPRRTMVASRPDFLAKAAEVLRLVRAELPPCCRGHEVPELAAYDGTAR
jgi:predicted ATPase